MNEWSTTLPPSDVFIIGSGPNGLSAAVAAAQVGLRVTVIERAETIGGGSRSSELTLPGFFHDVCSAIHPLAIGSPFFRTLPLAANGLDWVHPPAPLAHPFDDGTAVVLERSLDHTIDGLGLDGPAYLSLISPLVERWDQLSRDILAPFHLASHTRLLPFAIHALRPARSLAESRFRGQRARALFAGMAAHSLLPLENLGTSGFAFALIVSAHAVGWPMARGGAQAIPNALAAHLAHLGGKIITGTPVHSLRDLPPSAAILCDIGPWQLADIAADRLPRRFLNVLRNYRYGPAAFKVDYALSEPIPWKSPECARAGTVHLGGTLDEISASERATWRAEHAERPFVLLSQPTLFDPTRAPTGRHIAWAYCHVPHRSTFDMLPRLEAQIERFAPGFREIILARSVMPPAALERHNPNLVGGDINGGTSDIFQLFTRPTVRMYGTPAPGLYLCSASTPPGGGVHGMCGYYAAQVALREVFKCRLYCHLDEFPFRS